MDGIKAATPEDLDVPPAEDRVQNALDGENWDASADSDMKLYPDLSRKKHPKLQDDNMVIMSMLD